MRVCVCVVVCVGVYACFCCQCRHADAKELKPIEGVSDVVGEGLVYMSNMFMIKRLLC